MGDWTKRGSISIESFFRQKKEKEKR